MKSTSTIAISAIMAMLVFVVTVAVTAGFALKVFAQVVSSPSQVPTPSQDPHPSPNEQAIIHACVNIVHSQGRQPFCTGLSTPPPPRTTTKIPPGEGIASAQTISPASHSLTLPPSPSALPTPNG